MDRSDRAENQIDHLHCEDYHAKYDRRNINHQTMVFTENRPFESLNGRWYFTVDPYDTGLRMDWPLSGNEERAGRVIPWDYRYGDGELIPVPSCWNMIRPEYFHYEGSAWYARAFTYQPERAGERVFLRVGAANYETLVFLNDSYLGNHLGGSTPFYVELTESLRAHNVLHLCVNNSRTLDRVPMRNTDWFNYGGIYRDVRLYRLPADFIKDFFIHLVPDDTYSRLRVFVQLDRADAAGEITLELPELGLKETRRAERGIVDFTISARPQLWSPRNPRLYEVAVRYRDDRIEDRVGFRQIKTDGTRILLNGEELFLRGVSVHEDDLVSGKVSGEEDIRRRFADAKDLGCNFMRLAHYPHTELAAKTADAEGLLLWEEIPVYWAIDFENPSTYQDAENQLLELIKRDRNRCSVILWSVGNENADSDARLRFMGNLAKAAKTWDPSRLVTAACLVNHEKLRIEDRLAAHLDVIGLNEYYGWYSPDFEDLIALGRNSNPDRPVIISETGAGGLAGYHGTKTDIFSEEFMAEVYRRQVEIVRGLDYVKGISPWILYDFRTPRRCNSYQRGFNRKGLIAEDKKTRKLAFDVLRRFYAEKIAEEREREAGDEQQG